MSTTPEQIELLARQLYSRAETYRLYSGLMSCGVPWLRLDAISLAYYMALAQTASAFFEPALDVAKGLADRVAAQSELLGRRAEREPAIQLDKLGRQLCLCPKCQGEHTRTAPAQSQLEEHWDEPLPVVRIVDDDGQPE